jgi:hypothetical protein
MSGTPSLRLDFHSVPRTLVCLLLITLNANAAVVSHPRTLFEHPTADLDANGPSRAGSGVLHLPLTRRYGRPVAEQDHGQWARSQRDYLRMKYGDPATTLQSGTGLHARANGTAHLVNRKYIAILVLHWCRNAQGTPKTTQTLLFTRPSR